jgi:signal transduction histidine kinase/ActR/RegA family two-component response regulator
MLTSPGDNPFDHLDPGTDMGPPKAKGDQEGDAKGKQHDQGKDQSPPPDSFQNPLPGDDKIWQDCPLDIGSNLFLQSLAVTLSKFDYPAAVFWGFELVLIYNKAWEDAGGIPQQGRAQRGQLSPDAWHALQKCINGGKPAKIASHALLREKKRPDAEHYMVLASPLFGPGTQGAKGVFCQMITREETKEDDEKESGSQIDDTARKGKVANLKELGLSDDSTPLDEHPFFHRFAEMIPTGLAILDHNARAVFVNQHFYQLTTHWGEDQSFKSWPQSIHPDDYERVMGAYQRAFNGQSELRAEFRALGSEHPWRLLLLTPLGDENLRHVSLGEYGGFICSVVDITSEKSAENDQRIAAQEAMERKKQQERFIDMISHEIRNPLSAMVHCVEDINEALKEKEQTGYVDPEPIAEALDTINLCISHQKNIVDDVLSYSKLDSSMLALTPKPSQPEKELRGNAKMFQPEFRKHGIEFECIIDKPYNDLKVEWTMADLSRIGQVLINLISNAIKFTSRKDGKRKLVIKVSAAVEKPPSYPPDVVFFTADNDAPRLDATQRSEWGKGEPLYIMVAVTDTGIGIGEEDQKKLFERFKQATPKTNEIYGGSGLGLNISRKLVQLHGGEIGVKSTEGVGATFGFFFRVKRSGPPDTDEKAGEEKRNHDSVRGQIRVGGLDSKEESDAEKPAESRKPKSTGQLERTQSSAERAEQTGNLGKEIDDERHESRRPKKQQDTEVSLESESSKQRPPETQKQKQDRADKQGDGSDLATTGASMDPTAKSESHPASSDVTNKAPPGRKGKNKSDEKQSGQQSQSSSKSNNGRRDDHARENQQEEIQLPLRTRKDMTMPPHILFVEDNHINQKLVARQLAKKRFTVSTAKNGREAVDFVVASFSDPENAGKDDETKKQGEIDIILMDQEMPVMDGSTAAKEIRSREKEMGREKRVPILGVSANVREEQLQEMTKNGMDDFITKPYMIDDMVKKIGSMIDE